MAKELITLDEAAERLGVHYMTAYRYVRTGRLPAIKEGAEWRIDPAELDRLRPGRRRGADGGRPARDAYPGRLEARLVAGDEPGAWRVLDDALAAGMAPDELYVEVIGPALDTIGGRWADGTLTVAEEHQASAVVLRLIGRLGPLFRRRGRTRGTVIVGAAPGDTHGLPSALLADLLRARGLTVIDLGANPATDSFLDAARSADRLVAVGIAATSPDNEAGVTDAIRTLHSELDVPVVVGGSATAGLGADSGADRVTSDTAEAIEVFDDLATDAARRRRRATRQASR